MKLVISASKEEQDVPIRGHLYRHRDGSVWLAVGMRYDSMSQLVGLSSPGNPEWVATFYAKDGGFGKYGPQFEDLGPMKVEVQ